MPKAAPNSRNHLTHDAARISALRERSGWHLAPARKDDHEALLSEWIAADPYHTGQTADAWLRARPGVENLLLIDKKGPLFFLRCSNVMRTDIQFAPNEMSEGSREIRRRIGDALASGLPWLAAQARSRNFREMMFESKSPRLVRYLEGLGFKASATEYILSL
jgi:hypothetical protein